ncbi:MAG: hypothetical protein J6Q02_02540, partial [Lachnospiraceae bacterium]|nr:hypothetical protein [Lachnospiraceae bacterium]
MRKIFCDFCDCEIKDARCLVGVNVGEVEAEACEKCEGKLLRLMKYHEWKKEEKAVTKQKQEGDEDPEGQQTSGQNETQEQAG